VTYESVVISLPAADRRTSFDFYRQALSLEAVGEPDESGIPGPLQFAVNAGARVMLIPRGGFERAAAAGARVVLAPGQQPWGYVGAFADPDGHVWMVQADA
jgi:uncharacterized protein